MNSNRRRPQINKLNLIIAVVVTFAAWLYVVYNVSPTIVKTYRDVAVTYVGEDELAERGLGVESASVETVKLNLRISRMDLLDFSIDDVSVTADVSDLDKGEADVSIDVTTPDGVTVSNASHTRTSVTITPSNNIDVPVTVAYAKTTDDSKEPTASELSYDEVSVMGAGSVVDTVACVAVLVNEEDTTSEDGTDFTGTPIALDKNGDPIKHVVILPSEITGHADAASIKRVKLKLTVTETDSDDIERSYKAPKYIYIKGPLADINAISEVSATVDISGITRSSDVELTYSLPDGIVLANRSLDTRLKLTVK